MLSNVEVQQVLTMEVLIELDVRQMMKVQIVHEELDA